MSNIWRLERVKDTKFGMKVSNGSYLMLHSWKVTVFTVFELLGKKQQGKAFLNKTELKRDVKFIYPKNIFMKIHSAAQQTNYF